MLLDDNDDAGKKKKKGMSWMVKLLGCYYWNSETEKQAKRGALGWRVGKKLSSTHHEINQLKTRFTHINNKYARHDQDKVMWYVWFYHIESHTVSLLVWCVCRIIDSFFVAVAVVYGSSLQPLPVVIDTQRHTHIQTLFERCARVTKSSSENIPNMSIFRW